MWKKPRQNSWCDNSNNTFSTTASQLGGLAPLLYHYVEVIPNKIANHDKQKKYFTDTVARQKTTFFRNVGSGLRTLIRKHS